MSNRSYGCEPSTTSPKEMAICSVQFSKHNLIRLNGIPFPSDLIKPLRLAIETGWRNGLKCEQNYHGAYEFKLSGNPWNGHRDEGVESRSLLASMLKCFAQKGWTVLQSCDTCRKIEDKDIIFFEYTQPDPEVKVFAISFNRSNIIRLINPPESWLINHFTQALLKGWSDGTERVQDYCGSTEVKLKGNPWVMWNDRENIAAQLFLCYVIASFRRVGYKLYASVDLDSNNYNLDSWVFRKITDFWH